MVSKHFKSNEQKIKHYFLYPLYQGNIATILAPTLLFSLIIFITQRIGEIVGPYGAIPGLLLAIAIICFSLDYSRQIVKASAHGEMEPPQWNIARIDLEELFRGVKPVAVSFFESLFFAIPINLIISIIMDKNFVSQFIGCWKLIIFIPFVILYPINLLSYGTSNDFIITRLFRTLSKPSLLKILMVHALSLAALIYIILLPIWENPFFIFLLLSIIFYLFQIWAYTLGKYIKLTDYDIK